MRIGIPREVKVHENRVGLTPESVAELISAGADAVVQAGAGIGAGFADDDYRSAGARIGSVQEAFAADLVVKVKEPLLHECERLRPQQLLFTYLHLAADKPQALALMESGATAIAYETVTTPGGGLPLLTPMSEVAGRMSIQVGAFALQNANGGRGMLLGGVPGVAPARVVIIGGGVAGANAAAMAVGLQADVTILDKSISRLRELSAEFRGRARVLMASRHNLLSEALAADLVIGAVLVPGAAAPKLLTRDMVRGHEGRRRGRRYLHRPGWLFRNQPADHPRRSHLRRRRRGPLLRDQHAGGGGPHFHAGAQQRHAALRQGGGHPWLARGIPARRRICRRPECSRWRDPAPQSG